MRHIKDKQDNCLIEAQAKYIYKKVEKGSIVNVDAIKQETETDRLDKMDNINDKIKPYQEIIANKVEKDDTIKLQMEQW